MARQPEAKTSKKIRDYLRKRGARVVNIHGGDNPFQEVGVSDFLGCYRSRALAIETKTPAGKLSVKQERFLRSWREAGGYAIVATSVADVKSLLDRIDEEVDSD
jgi:hypothetical protein